MLYRTLIHHSRSQLYLYDEIKNLPGSSPYMHPCPVLILAEKHLTITEGWQPIPINGGGETIFNAGR